jgi:hypothetical protein
MLPKHSLDGFGRPRFEKKVAINKIEREGGISAVW